MVLAKELTESDEKIENMLSLRRMAIMFDCKMADGSPATDTILKWCRAGRIPPPDLKMSQKAVYWKPDTIKSFIENGGVC